MSSDPEQPPHLGIVGYREQPNSRPQRPFPTVAAVVRWLTLTGRLPITASARPSLQLVSQEAAPGGGAVSEHMQRIGRKFGVASFVPEDREGPQQVKANDDPAQAAVLGRRSCVAIPAEWGAASGEQQ